MAGQGNFTGLSRGTSGIFEAETGLEAKPRATRAQIISIPREQEARDSFENRRAARERAIGPCPRSRLFGAVQAAILASGNWLLCPIQPTLVAIESTS
jgi:hypothetical protein